MPRIGGIIMQTIMICSQFPTEVIMSVITVYGEKENPEQCEQFWLQDSGCMMAV